MYTLLSTHDKKRCMSIHNLSIHWHTQHNRLQLECGPMPNVMAVLPNIGGALCSTPQFG